MPHAHERLERAPSPQVVGDGAQLGECAEVLVRQLSEFRVELGAGGAQQLLAPRAHGLGVVECDRGIGEVAPPASQLVAEKQGAFAATRARVAPCA
eukprot:112081-Pleurochrysis_carterae.AAC.2